MRVSSLENHRETSAERLSLRPIDELFTVTEIKGQSRKAVEIEKLEVQPSLCNGFCSILLPDLSTIWGPCP